MKYFKRGDIVNPYADQDLPPGVLASDNLVVLEYLGRGDSARLRCQNPRTGAECELLGGEVVLVPPRRTIEPGDRCEFRKPTKHRGRAKRYQPLGDLAPEEGEILVALAIVRPGDRRVVKVQRPNGREALIYASDLLRIMPDNETIAKGA
jgi:hypothetical protein